MDVPVELIEIQVQRGSILHSTMFDEIDHGKFFVIVGVSKDYVAGFFFINSNIHRSLYGKKEQFEMQYPLKHSDYSFLKHDSFLCATNIIRRERSVIARSIASGQTKYVGELKNNHMNDILDMVRKSKLFNKIEKEMFFC